MRCFINYSPKASHIKKDTKLLFSGVWPHRTVYVCSSQPVFSSRAAVKTRRRRTIWNATAGQAKQRILGAASAIRACLANTTTWRRLLQTDRTFFFIQTTWTQPFPKLKRGLGQRPLTSWRWTCVKRMSLSPVFNFSKVADSVSMADRTGSTDFSFSSVLFGMESFSQRFVWKNEKSPAFEKPPLGGWLNGGTHHDVRTLQRRSRGQRSWEFLEPNAVSPWNLGDYVQVEQPGYNTACLWNGLQIAVPERKTVHRWVRATL